MKNTDKKKAGRSAKNSPANLTPSLKKGFGNGNHTRFFDHHQRA